jgi:hypothetical protein
MTVLQIRFVRKACVSPTKPTASTSGIKYRSQPKLHEGRQEKYISICVYTYIVLYQSGIFIWCFEDGGIGMRRGRDFIDPAIKLPG